MTRWSTIGLLATAAVLGCREPGPVTGAPPAEAWGWCMADADAVPTQLDAAHPSLRHAELLLRVDDVEAAMAGLTPLLQTYGAFEAGRTPARIRLPDAAPTDLPWPATTLTLRVEVGVLNRLMREVARLGTVLRDQRRTADASQAVVELQARLATERQNEERIQARIDDPATDRATIPALEGEISRIRERSAGLGARLYVIENSLPSATLVLHVVSAPAPGRSPGFWRDVRATFLGPDDAPGAIALHLLALGVASLPWVALAILATALILRRGRRHRAAG